MTRRDGRAGSSAEPIHCAAPTVEAEPAPAAEGAATEPEVLKEKKPAEGEAAAADAKGGDKKAEAKKPEKK